MQRVALAEGWLSSRTLWRMLSERWKAVQPNTVFRVVYGSLMFVIDFASCRFHVNLESLDQSATLSAPSHFMFHYASFDINVLLDCNIPSPNLILRQSYQQDCASISVLICNARS